MQHSLIFPLPFGIHVGFVIFSVIMLILCYKHWKYMYDLYMLIGIVSTLLVYTASSKPVFYILGLEEVILLILVIVDMTKVSIAKSKAEKEKQAEKETEEQT